MAKRRWFDTRLISAVGGPDLTGSWSSAMSDQEIKRDARLFLNSHPKVARMVITERIRKTFYTLDASKEGAA